MGSLGDYAELKLLEHVVGKTSYAMPTAYIALSTGDFGETGVTTSEPATNCGYIRQATSAGHWSSAAAGAIVNAGAITMPQCSSATWGTIAYFGIWDAATPGSGGLIGYGTVSPTKAISSGDTLQFAANAISITSD